MKPILIIAPHRKIYDNAVIASRRQSTIRVEYGLLEDAVPIARAAQQKGAEVIITRGGTAKLLERTDLAIPIVDIMLSPFNMFSAIHEARDFDREITVVGSNRIIHGVEKLGKILDVALEIHEIFNRNQAEEYVKSRMRSKHPIKVLLGGAIAESLAREYDLPTVFLETSVEDIERSVEEANRLMKVRRLEAQKTEQFKAILDNINHGVIAVDNAEIINIFNKAAGKITGIPQGAAEGKKLSDILPQKDINHVLKKGHSQLGRVISFGRVTTLSNKVPVKVGTKIAGAVETLEDVTKIKEYENIIRTKMAKKGYSPRFRFDDIIGESPELVKTIRLAKKFASVESIILIGGESGTGKEVFAQAIHSDSSRKSGPFVAVNCGALPDSILESELFGYQAGAFSGAHHEGKDGLFTQAHTGTIFLDEIGETSQTFQTTLLRVIQEMEVRPLGSDRVIPIDVRIIAATNRDLKQEMDRKNFRSDLFYRLNILRLHMPPLRFRKKDIPQLARHFIRNNAAKLGREFPITKQAVSTLCNYSWPGNIRELQNVIERLCVTCDKKIDTRLVTESLDEIDETLKGASDQIDHLKHRHIRDILKHCNNNKAKAAQKLGISRTTLWRALKE